MSRGKGSEVGTYRQNVRNSKESSKKLGAVGSYCNPSYSGRRDQEDGGSKPTLGK
jgi:hypothetical protein